MDTRDIWHRRAIRSNDRLHWNAYRYFRQKVKRELRFAEMAHVRTELLKSKGNTNAIWKIINNCLPRKSRNRPFRGTQRGYSSKPLNIASLNVF